VIDGRIIEIVKLKSISPLLITCNSPLDNNSLSNAGTLRDERTRQIATSASTRQRNDEMDEDMEESVIKKIKTGEEGDKEVVSLP